jgi:hypothetical protein
LLADSPAAMASSFEKSVKGATKVKVCREHFLRAIANTRTFADAGC